MATHSSILTRRMHGQRSLVGNDPQHGGSERPGKLELGGASRNSTGFGALEEGLISS